MITLAIVAVLVWTNVAGAVVTVRTQPRLPVVAQGEVETMDIIGSSPSEYLTGAWWDLVVPSGLACVGADLPSTGHDFFLYATDPATNKVNSTVGANGKITGNVRQSDGIVWIQMIGVNPPQSNAGRLGTYQFATAGAALGTYSFGLNDILFINASGLPTYHTTNGASTSGLQLTNQSFTVAHEGDASLDGFVDVVDLGVLAVNYDTPSGATWGMGDFNHDGAVDVVDLGILSGQYNWSGLPGDPVIQLPEPASMVCLVLAGAALIRGKRRSA